MDLDYDVSYSAEEEHSSSDIQTLRTERWFILSSHCLCYTHQSGVRVW